EAERKQSQRASQKAAHGQPLTTTEREVLGLIKKRPGAYKSELGRPMTPPRTAKATERTIERREHYVALLGTGFFSFGPVPEKLLLAG
ncbi:5378_t:CDS:1, partial [Racocetra persica]